MQAYSREMWRDVLAACDRGQGTREVAGLLRVSESWVAGSVRHAVTHS